MGETKVLKLKEGDDVIESLKEFAQKNSIEHGFIKEAQGSIKNFEISSFAGRGSIENIREKNTQEILAINGQISKSRGEFAINLKVSVSRPGLNAVSGLLLRAEAGEGLEIAVQKSDVGKIIYA